MRLLFDVENGIGPHFMQQLTVEQVILVYAPLERKAFFHATLTGGAHCLSPRRIEGQLPGRCAQSLRVFNRYNEAGFTVYDGLSIAADVCDDHWKACGHAFENCVGKTFLVRTKNAELR